MKRHHLAAIAAALAATSAVTPTQAQVGEQINKDISNNISLDAGLLNGVPPEAEHVFLKYLRTYVPAQLADGTAAPDVEYRNILGNLEKTRAQAKPLISVFNYGPADYPAPAADENVGGFGGHGKRDAFAAVSFDDGNTWKTTNLSDSAVEFSTAIPSYPGDVISTALAVAGNHIAVAWASRYCSSGAPAYTADTDSTYIRDLADVATDLGIDPAHDLYLTDLFGVAGSQGLVDYSAQGYPTVGEVPFACLWSARGVLKLGDDPRTVGTTETSYVVWYKPERLTSGVRDVARVEIAFVGGAGVALVWQEDPEGLLPGQGEGPGEGWSGATANSQTDIWYSFLPDANFESVVDSAGDPQDLDTYLASDSNKPKPYVPFAVPMRLTNNARCLGGGSGGGTRPYCTATALDYGLKNQCADTVDIPTGQNSETTQICVSEDGMPNVANVAATRPRLSLQPKSGGGAWATVVAEESKGLGSFFFKTGETLVETAMPCTEGDADCEVADEGKNVLYYSFEMGSPSTDSDLSSTGLVKNLLA